MGLADISHYVDFLPLFFRSKPLSPWSLWECLFFKHWEVWTVPVEWRNQLLIRMILSFISFDSVSFGSSFLFFLCPPVQGTCTGHCGYLIYLEYFFFCNTLIFPILGFWKCLFLWVFARHPHSLGLSMCEARPLPLFLLAMLLILLVNFIILTRKCCCF